LVLDQVSKDKGIERDILIQALEEAILAAAKRTFGVERDLLAQFNAEKGAVDLSQTIRVVSNEDLEDTYNEITLTTCDELGIEVEIGDEMVFPIYYLDQDADAAKEQDEEYGDILRLKTYRRGFGRIAAQTAKQVIIQRIRDAERGIVYGEYKDRKGELVTGIVRRFERGNVIVDLGRAEAILPVREQCPRESYRAGDRVQAYVREVQEISRGPQIVLSRTASELLIKLFEIEVPEIYEGIVRIESAAREPGARAKIAVSSSDRDVDPVGACVGMKGSRVQNVVQELRGEKIDIVPYSEDPATFVCNALQPAEVSRVLIDEANHGMEIIVPDDQLSLAIGRKGQNVRLASQLAGWKLDIHSESRIQEIKDRAWQSLSKVEGCNEFLIQTLYNHGIRSAAQLLDTDRDYLLQFPGLTDENIDTVMESATKVAEQEAKDEEAARIEADRASKAVDSAKALQELLNLTEEERMKEIRNVGEATFELLSEHGYSKVEVVADSTIEELSEKLGLNDKKAKQLQYAAKQRIKLETEIRETADLSGIEVIDGVVRIPGQEEEEAEAEAGAEEIRQLREAV
jgi:N utilization substance protein A